MKDRIRSKDHSRNVAKSRKKIKLTINRKFRHESKRDFYLPFVKGLFWELV
jgi:hypothetical protein